jgi:hypothetical protein
MQVEYHPREQLDTSSRDAKSCLTFGVGGNLANLDGV